MSHKPHLGLFAAAMLLAAANPLDAITMSSTFDSGLEGWTVNNTTPVLVATGGNPGGYMFIDNPETTVSEMVAPAAFLGDRSQAVLRLGRDDWRGG